LGKQIQTMFTIFFELKKTPEKRSLKGIRYRLQIYIEGSPILCIRKNEGKVTYDFVLENSVYFIYFYFSLKTDKKLF